jgi:SAM-dependent methyltransferase
MTRRTNLSGNSTYGRYSLEQRFYSTFWPTKEPIFNADQNCRAAFFSSMLIEIRNITNRPLRIIDIGCGNGWLTAELSRFGSATGLDLYADAARVRHPKLAFIDGDILTLDLDQRFDVVVTSEVIEHLLVEDQPRFVRKCSNLLFPRGWLVLTTPNPSVMKRLVAHIHLQPQPIENWLKPQELRALVESFFEVRFHGSIRFCPDILRKYKVTRLSYGMFYDVLKLFKIIDRALGSSMNGLYQALVAVRK